MANFKPTGDHWKEFANAVIKLRVFDEFLQLAGQQSMMQFANVLPFMEVDESSQPAKENAVFNLIYINLTRIVFAQMINDDNQPILSIEFFNKMAKIKTEAEMEEFVRKEFLPIVRSPTQLGHSMPKLKRSWDAITNLVKHLYKNVSGSTN